MRTTTALPMLLLAAACGGGYSAAAPAAGAAPTAASASIAVEQFMRAVADSNLTRMGQYWGTARGAAAVTGEPANWQQRVVVMQLYLSGGSFRVIGDVPAAGGGDRRVVTIDLVRGTCSKQVPFTLGQAPGGGWIIVSLDLNDAGNPARPCGDS